MPRKLVELVGNDLHAYTCYMCVRVCVFYVIIYIDICIYICENWWNWWEMICTHTRVICVYVYVC